jgi:phosphate-selective porin OprO/OprP
MAAPAAPVWAAEEPTPTVAEELLEILRAAGTIDDAKYQELRERARLEEQQRVDVAVEKAVEAAAALPPVAAAEDGPTDWKVKWDNGFKVERNDGQFKLKFGGRIQSDFALIDQSNELEENIGGEGNGHEFRRARLFFSGTLYDQLIFKSQFDFANTGDGKVDVKDLYMGLKDLGPLGTVRVGHMKEPFSLDEQGSSKYLVFMERGLPNVFSPGRNVGVMAHNAVLDKKLYWGLGIFHDANDSGFGFDDNSAWNVTGRLAGTPVYGEDGRKVVHLGASYTHQFRGGDFMLRYRQRPEAHLSTRYVDTAKLSVEDVDILGLEFATVLGPFSLQSEYMRSWARGRDARNTNFWGTYVQASYFLTGEARNYDLGKARFSRVKPNQNFNPSQGDWGGWEIGARFSYLDLEDHHAEGGRMWDVTAALNWYLYPNARMMLNYVHSHLDDRVIPGSPGVFTVRGIGGQADIVQARFQLDF